MSDWTERQHAAHIRTRYFSGGWEFDTANDAREYVNEQFAKYPEKDLRNTPFQFEVATNGVTVRGYVTDTIGAMVSTRTYKPGKTMRDRLRVVSPTDCDWMIPGGDF